METPQENNTFINWLLTGIVAFCTFIEHSTADEIYTWVFRGFSLFSLLLIIIINWKKAWLTLFPKKEK